MNRRWLTMFGFFTALAYLVVLLSTYVIAHWHGYLVLLDLNHHGEWGVELAILAVSIPLVLYAMLDYWRMIERAEDQETRKRKALKTHYMRFSSNSQLFSKSRTTGCHLVQETSEEAGHGLD